MGTMASVKMAQFGRHQHFHAFAGELTGFVAEYPFKKWIRVDDCAGLIGNDDPIRQCFEKAHEVGVQVLALILRRRHYLTGPTDSLSIIHAWSMGGGERYSLPSSLEDGSFYPFSSRWAKPLFLCEGSEVRHDVVGALGIKVFYR